MRINLGCGHNPIPGWINADIRSGLGVDIVLDAEKPLPFKTSSIDEIRAFGLLEHLWHWELLMTEAARVLRAGGAFGIRVPYKTDYVPYHVRHFDKNSFNPYRSDYRHRDYDLRRRTHSFASLEFSEPYFTLDEMWVEHWIPFTWHIEKYLRIKNVSRLPIGRRLNLNVTLRRNGEPWRP